MPNKFHHVPTNDVLASRRPHKKQNSKRMHMSSIIEAVDEWSWSFHNYWSNKPAGFYSQTWFARIGFKEFFDTQQPKSGDATAKEITLNWTKCSAYIAGADGLSKEEKEALIQTQLIWSGYTLTVKELESAIDEAVHMNTDQAIDLAKKSSASWDVGAYQSCVHLLYFTLQISGVDGLSDEEKAKFVEIGRAMNIKEEDINEVIDVYMMEIAFGKRLHRLLGAMEQK
eukprot:186728_1